MCNEVPESGSHEYPSQFPQTLRPPAECFVPHGKNRRMGHSRELLQYNALDCTGNIMLHGVQYDVGNRDEMKRSKQFPEIRRAKYKCRLPEH